MAGKKLNLNEKHIIRLAMLASDNNIKSLAEKIGVKANALSNQLSRPDSTMTLTSIFAALDAMGFDIVARERNGDAEYTIEDISESSSEWEKKLAIEQANATVRRIEAHDEQTKAIKSEMKPPERR